MSLYLRERVGFPQLPVCEGIECFPAHPVCKDVENFPAASCRMFFHNFLFVTVCSTQCCVVQTRRSKSQKEMKSGIVGTFFVKMVPPVRWGYDISENALILTCRNTECAGMSPKTVVDPRLWNTKLGPSNHDPNVLDDSSKPIPHQSQGY